MNKNIKITIGLLIGVSIISTIASKFVEGEVLKRIGSAIGFAAFFYIFHLGKKQKEKVKYESLKSANQPQMLKGMFSDKMIDKNEWLDVVTGFTKIENVKDLGKDKLEFQVTYKSGTKEWLHATTTMEDGVPKIIKIEDKPGANNVQDTSTSSKPIDPESHNHQFQNPLKPLTKVITATEIIWIFIVNLLIIGGTMYYVMQDQENINEENLFFVFLTLAAINGLFFFKRVIKKGFFSFNKETIQKILTQVVKKGPGTASTLSLNILKAAITNGPQKEKLLKTINKIKQIKKLKEVDDQTGDFLTIHHDDSEHWYRATRKDGKIISLNMYT